MNKLEQAARALLAHWDTPAWKYLKPTGDLMADLREALAEQAEQEPECKYKEAYIIWQDKTEWVQETAQPKELGMHRADVLRQRIENLQNAAPVRTKDLKDEEIEAIMVEQGDLRTTAFARAVIAADREKNK